MNQPVNFLIGFSQASIAHLLVNRLNRSGIEAFYSFTQEYNHTVCLKYAEDRGRAELEVKAFLDSPDFSKEQELAWKAEKTVSSSSRIDVNHMLQRIKQAPVASVILLVCWTVFIFSSLGSGQLIFNVLHINDLASLSQSHQWWRLVTPAFFHFDILHILFNAMWWWVLGEKIELRLGHFSLLLLAFICALISNLGQLWMVGPNFGGLSGVVYGLVGFVGYLTYFRPHWQVTIDKPLLGFFIFWLVLGFTELLPINIANTAHLVGLISGIGCGFILCLFPSNSKINPDKDT